MTAAVKTLGLDLGTNSLGWAVIDENSVQKTGVLVFEEGVNREQDKSLKTPASERRTQRMARRLRFRRHLRRRLILKILIEQKMCPLTQEEWKTWFQPDKGDKAVFPKGNVAFVEWLKSTDTRNPYCDRARAATENVDPLTLGRAIYHLAQRRGFKSGRKDQPEDGEESNSAKAKKLGKVKGEIARISAELDKSGLTLGQYFFNEIQVGRKVRKQHTGRVEHYEKEWVKIAKTQNLDQALADKIARALFWQRPLREQSHLIGKCLLELKRNRAQIGHPDFEEFRALSFVNNIRLVDGEKKTYLDDKERCAALDCFNRNKSRIPFCGKNVKTIPLTPEERAVAAEFFIMDTKGKPRYNPDAKATQNKLKFETLGNLLRKKFPELKGAAFNYEDNDSLSPSKITAALTDVLPNRTDWQTAFDALTFFDRFVDGDEKLKDWAQKVEIQRKDKYGKPREPSKGLGLSEEAAKKFIKIRIPEGRASYSLHAIRKINRFLRKGFELSQAIFLAKCPDVLRDFNEYEDTFIKELEIINIDYHKDLKKAEREDRYPESVPTLEERRRDWFSGKVKQDWVAKVEKPFESLIYFRDPKADSSYATPDENQQLSITKGVLPKVNLGMIRNPLVQRSMTMLRRLVNELRRKGDIDATTRIHIELAREVNSRNDRMAIQEWQKQNKAKREAAEKALKQYIAQPTEADILKYLLWEEQKFQCPYTGKQIALCPYTGKEIKDIGFFAGFDIEHTIPRSRSGDDSQANKTLCDLNFNRNIKKGMMPSELPDHDVILARLKPWKDKIDDLKKLKKRQAADAKVISKANAEDRSKARQKMLVTKLDLKYWEDKYYRFIKKPDDITPSFISRQLVDTGIMTRHAVALLKTVYPDVYPVNGKAVAFARKMWKVQAEDAVKDRSDHTHHAKDALVIAALSRDRFQKICAELKTDDERKNPKFTVAPPFDGFAQAVYDATAAILVKHVTRHNELKQTRRKSIRLSSPKKVIDKQTNEKVTRAHFKTGGDTVRGQLHEDTFYGKIKKPGDTKTVCVIRKSLASCNEKDILAIVDPIIRKCVQDKLAQIGGDFKKAIVQDVFKMESGVPIRKVRIEVTPHTSLNEIRHHTTTPSKHDYKVPVYACTAAGSNLGIAVYQLENGNPHFIIEKLFDHVREVVPEPPSEATLLGRILPGAMAQARPLVECKDVCSPKSPVLLYKVRKFTENAITLWFHREARAKKDFEQVLKEIKAQLSEGNLPDIERKRLEDIKKSHADSSSLDYNHPYARLCLNLKKAWASFLFEGIHFTMDLDGTIHFKDTLC